MNALLKKARWVPALRVLLVALAAQPAVAAIVSSTAVRWPLVGAVIAAVEAMAAGLSVRVTSEPADAPKPPGPTT